MGLKIGICGIGRFGKLFVQLFNAHPGVEEIVLADSIIQRAETTAQQYGVKRVLPSLDALCESNVDAIALFTQRHLHGPQTVKSLQAGKHVYSAVPAGISVEEVSEIARAVERTGLLYMTGETSYYYPSTLYCRKHFSAGDFGRFVYAEAQYLHDMDNFYASFQHSGGPEWKMVTGFPPMYYSTHSISMVLSVTGAHATHVSCMGSSDDHLDDIFSRGSNIWDNTFCNESALMRTSEGGVIRINEMRSIGFHGANSVYMSFFGTEGSFEQNAISSCWNTKDEKPPEDLTETLSCRTPAGENYRDGNLGKEFHIGVSRVHPVERLPDSFKGLPNGHYGSHQFLVDDFVTAWSTGTIPPCSIWNAARWCVPGIIAHESAKQGGKLLEIPDFGDPPNYKPS